MKFIIGWFSFMIFMAVFIWKFFLCPNNIEELDGDISHEGIQCDEPTNESRFEEAKRFARGYKPND